MTHRTPHRSLVAVLAAALAPVLGVSAAIAVPSAAQAAVSKANCRLHQVLLSKEGDGNVPKELAFLRDTLKNDEFAIYKGFYLLERKTLKLDLESRVDAGFGTGHKLGLTLLGGDDAKLKLRAELTGRDGVKSLLDTTYSIQNNGQLMISAGSHTDAGRSGKLFFAIQCGSSA